MLARARLDHGPLAQDARIRLCLAGISLVLLLAGCSSSNPDAGIDTPPVAPPLAGDRSADAGAGFDVPVWVTTLPRLALPGAEIHLSGQGFRPGEGLTATLSDRTGEVAVVGLGIPADGRGRIVAARLPLPESAKAAGEYTLTVSGQDSQRSGTTTIWIGRSTPSATLSTVAAPPEAPLTIAASGFAPRERVVVFFEGQEAEPITALSADGNGDMVARDVPIPLVPPGQRALVIAGSASLVQVRQDFSVTPFAPAVMLNADILPIGGTASLHGYGFAARDQVRVVLEGSDEAPALFQTDDRGRLFALGAFVLPTAVKGTQAFAVSGQRTGSTVRVPFQVLGGYPLVELSSYLGPAGTRLNLAVRYLRPRERIDVYVGEGGQRKKLATFRADDNGWLPKEAPFLIPSDAQAGPLTLALEGEAARPPMRARFVVG